MAQIKLLLLDEDHYFGDMLSAYVRASTYAERFELHWFTSKEEGSRYMAKLRERFIVLAHESFLPLEDAVIQQRAGYMVVVSEEEHEGTLQDFPVMFKFQPLHRLLSAVVARYNEYSQKTPLRGQGKTGIITVYSAVGGSGKTMTAVHTAARLAAMGERVLCMTLERLPSRAWFEVSPSGKLPPYNMDMSADADAFSRLLYYVKSKPEQIPAKIEQMKREDGRLRCDVLPPPRGPSEWDEISPDDMARLLEGAASSGIYDRIIIDADSMDQPAIWQLLSSSDTILWPLYDDYIHLSKTRELLDSWHQRGLPHVEGLNGKTLFIHNKNTGSRVNNPEQFGLNITSSLPYIPEWKAVAHSEILLRTGFADETVSLLHVSERVR